MMSSPACQWSMGHVINTLYDHVNDIQKHVFKAGYVLNFTRAVNDIIGDAAPD
jgi:hypothetical protein